MNQKNQRNHGPDNVPELRFPEFEGEWAETKMGEVFNSKRNKGNNSLQIYSVSQEHGLVPRETLDRNIQKNAISESNLSVIPGDIVYNMMRMWQGAIGLANSKCMVSPAYVVLRPNENECSTFYSYLFTKNRSLYLFWAYSYGLTNDRLRLYFKDFSDIKRSVPPNQEQQKIASFLTAVDERIQGLQKKKAKLEEYKKGVMQKLFNGEWKIENGKRVFVPPTFRFRPDLMEFEKLKMENSTSIFNSQFSIKNYPDWEEMELGQVCTFFSGGTPTSTNKNYYSGEIPFIGSGEIYHNVTEKKITQFALENSSAKIVEVGDLLFALYGATSGQVAISKIKGAINQAILCIRTNEIDKVFLFHLLSLSKGKIISKYLQGGQGNLSANIIRNLKFVIPNSIAEQQKIASFLSSLDEAIEKVRQQIDQSQVFKKGLLQKMFV